MAAKSSFAVLLFLCVLVYSANPSLGQYGEQQKHDQRVREARECRIQRLSISRPSRRIESEGGVTELWNEEDEQFQCAGVAAMRNIIQPDSLSLPNFSPSPRLVYIERGQGLLGISIPGCVEAFHSRGRSQSPEETIRGARGDESIRDQHQKVHRIRQGDIVALPAGVAHWSYNDGNEELVAFSVSDLNSETNQLDQRLRSFYLAGGQPREEYSGEQTREQGRETFGQSIVRGFDSNVIADAFNIPTDLARKIQREDNRGLIVRVQKGGMSVITPDEDDVEEEGSYGRRGPAAAAVVNRLEESYCTVRLTKNINNVHEADVYSRQAGRLYTVNRNKLPVLGLIGMSAEKGSLYPNAIFAPQWSMNAHVIKYITRGEGRIQVVGQSGKTMLDVTVKPGDVVVVPQYFASVKKAGNNGLEWVSFKTSSLPMRTPLAGASSAFMGFPLQVLANAYQISNTEARDLKYRRQDHFVVLPPSSSSSRPTTAA